MRKTPLEQWIAAKLGKNGSGLSADELRDYQLSRIRETIEYARRRSPFYRDLLADFDPEILESLEDLALLPFTTPDDIVNHHKQFLCVSQSEIERVVTLAFPGMTDKPRRLYFTAADLRLTVDFFQYGMSTLVEPGQKVLILMPGDRPASVGDLLAKALNRIDVRAIVHGIVKQPVKVIQDICRHEIDCLVGIPAQVLSIARHPRVQEIPSSRIKSILLSADYVPEAIVRELEQVWGCRVFNHYGTTEMGLGGGVECEALSGYHLREADLYFEITDPESGKTQAPGVLGEIVFTTLTRTGMPLIRYRTGDLAEFMTAPCPCGTVLRRMGRVRGRLHEMVQLRTGEWLGIPDLDEALFPFSEIVNYSVSLIPQQHADSLKINIYPKLGADLPDQEAIRNALLSVPQVKSAVDQGYLSLQPVSFTTRNWITTGVAKRSIVRATNNKSLDR